MSGAFARSLPVFKGLVALALATAGWMAVRAAGYDVDAGSAVFALGFLAVAGTAAGAVAAVAGLPRLTGYLLAGIVAGPQGFGLLSPDQVRALSLVNALALALISLQAGGELTLETLRRIWKSVGYSSLAQIVLVIAPMAAVFVAAAPYLSSVEGVTGGSLWALGILWGVLMLTRSPTVTMAVISEARARGPLAEHALGVVVLLDVLVLPLFAAALALTRGQLVGESFQAHAFVELGEELFASMAAGVTFGLLLALLLWSTKERVLVLVVFGYALTAVSSYLHYDTLLVFVVAGFVVTNLTKFGHTLVHASEQTGAAVMIVFFATAGAKLDIEALRSSWPVAVAFCVARVVFTLLATRVGHRLAGDPEPVRRGAWLGMVSQAGVTIGLATIVADALPGLGRPFASLIIAVVALNTVVGAALFKLALGRAGEIPTSGPEGGAPSPPAVERAGDAVEHR